MILKDVLNLLLQNYDVVQLHVDADAEGVVLPKHLEGPTRLDLRFDAPRPVTDLRVGDTGVSCLMSFSGADYCVTLPWRAVGMFVVPGLAVCVTEGLDECDEPAEPRGLRLVK